MRIGGLTSAHKAGLRGNKFQMRLVTQPFGLGDREKTLVDLSGQPLAQGTALPATQLLAIQRTPRRASRIVDTDFSATRFSEGPQP